MKKIKKKEKMLKEKELDLTVLNLKALDKILGGASVGGHHGLGGVSVGGESAEGDGQ